MIALFLHFLFISQSGALPMESLPLKDPSTHNQAEPIAKLCESTNEYIKTLQYLRENKKISLPEEANRKIAHEVSRNCDGAHRRFKDTYELLDAIGLNRSKAIEIASKFASESDETQKAFTEVFKIHYLTEFFDSSYGTALAVAYDLSLDFEGDKKQLRLDFIKLVDYCRSEKGNNLPVTFCAQYCVKVARLGLFFEDPIFERFKNTYEFIQSNKGLGVSIKDSLDITYQILSHGPKAIGNFITGFNYATNPEGLDQPDKKALTFALEMVQFSTTHFPPPKFIPKPKKYKSHYE